MLEWHEKISLRLTWALEKNVSRNYNVTSVIVENGDI